MIVEQISSSAKKRGDWSNTKELCDKGKEWIINEIKEFQN